ncbi:hypothetical protein ACLOJK_005650 [Asimina triloba]
MKAKFSCCAGTFASGAPAVGLGALEKKRGGVGDEEEEGVAGGAQAFAVDDSPQKGIDESEDHA